LPHSLSPRLAASPLCADGIQGPSTPELASKAVPRAQHGAPIPNLTGRGKRVRWRRVRCPSGHAAPPGHLDLSRTALKTSIVRDYRSRCVPQDNLLATREQMRDLIREALRNWARQDLHSTLFSPTGHVADDADDDDDDNAVVPAKVQRERGRSNVVLRSHFCRRLPSNRRALSSSTGD
jgi:hypothetical protein